MNTLIQGSQEWLEFRKSRIGSSDAAVIMGVSPWKTPLMLWQEKLGLVEPQKPSWAMNYGTNTEEEARAKFEEYIGELCIPAVKVSAIYPWIMASYDGMSFCEAWAVEIKCPGEEDHKIALSGKVPEKYYPQVQHQFIVTSSLAKIYYWSYYKGEGHCVEVERDEDYIVKLLEKEQKFYNLMQLREAPEMSDKDYSVREDSAWVMAERDYIQAEDAFKAVSERKEAARKRLLELTDRSAVGQYLRVTSYVQKGNVDYGKIPELSGLDLDQYRTKPSQRWRIAAK